MYSTVLEHNGRLVYALLNENGDVHEVISEQLTTTEEEICTGCQIRMGIFTLAVAGKRAEKLCRICLDKKTGAM